MNDQMGLDEVLSALSDVQRRLLDLPADAWRERFELQSEQDGLRARADEIRAQHDPDEGRTDQELKAEAAALRRHMRLMASKAGGLVTSKGGGNQSPGSGAMAALDVQGKQTRAGEIERMAARVDRIERVLAERREG